MADVKEVLEWAESLCNLAMTEARGGDASLANRVGSNSALKLFMDNVIGLKSVSAANFPAYYSVQWKEITRLYEQYLRDEEAAQTVDKVAALESKFDTLTEMVQKLLDAQQAPVAEAVEPKKGKKTAETVEVTSAETTETTAESAAESEA